MKIKILLEGYMRDIAEHKYDVKTTITLIRGKNNIRAPQNPRKQILVSFPRKRESSVYQYSQRLDPRFRGDDRQKFEVFRGAL